MLSPVLKSNDLLTRVVDADPDPDWIRIQRGPWIRIRIRNPDPDPAAEKLTTNLNILNILWLF